MSYNPNPNEPPLEANSPLAPSPYPFQPTPPPNLPVPAERPAERLPTPALANFCFFVAIIAFLAVSIVGELGNWGFAATSAAGQLTLALTAVLFCLLGRFNFRETFSLHKISWLTLFLCALLGFVGQFAVRFPSALNQWVMQVFGPFPLEDLIPNPKTDLERVLFVLVVVIAAPICEEVLNRGFVLAGYRRLSFGKNIVFVGLLFGVFHLYPFRFGYTFLLGMALAYLVLVTRSLYSAIAAHFGFNLLGGFTPWLYDWVENFSRESGRNLLEEQSQLDFSTVITTIPLSLGAGAIFFLLLRSITKRMARLRPELELGYFGLARSIRPEQTAPGGPYYGPDRRYDYGRWGYAPAANGLPPFDGSNPQSYNANTQPAPASWNYPPAPKQGLSATAHTMWLVSFVAIALLFAYTSLTEILIRQRPANAEPIKTPRAIVRPLATFNLPPPSVVLKTSNEGGGKA